MRLGQGEKQLTVPKVGQMTSADLVDGVDLTESGDIGMTTADLTTGEVGLKVILTDKLLRQENEDVFAIVGRQMGDAQARKEDTDLIALFSALNGGTSYGSSGSTLTLENLAACIATAKSSKFPSPVAFVHHPNAIFSVTRNSAAIPSTNAPIPRGWSEDLLRDFYRFVINQVAVFEDGNIASGVASVGAIFSREAIVQIKSVDMNTERERDASLRAWELVVTSDYGVFELDDTYGAPVTYTSAAPSTTA